MKSKFILFSIVTLFSVCSLAAPAEFELQWDKEKLPFEIRLAQSIGVNSSRVGETGIATADASFPGLKVLENGRLTLQEGDKGILLLMIRNTSKRKIKFSVAPHSTNPGEAALGFSFQCLCNGHVYEVGPSETWYRVMQLTYKKSETKEIVKLKHVIFEVTSSRKPQAHHH